MLLGTEHRLQFRAGQGGGPLHDLQLLVALRVADDDVEHEAVELRFGERIGPFLFDGVLRGQHEERLGQMVRVGAGGDVVLLHRFEERRLRLRRSPVDLVGQDHVGENRTFQEDEFAPARLGIVLKDVGAGDVGRHQVGRELNALERQVQDLRDGADQQRLGQARHADEQAMAAAEEGHEQFLDHFLLADDDAADLLGHLLIGGGKITNGLGFGGRNGRIWLQRRDLQGGGRRSAGDCLF